MNENDIDDKIRINMGMEEYQQYKQKKAEQSPLSLTEAFGIGFAVVLVLGALVLYYIAGIRLDNPNFLDYFSWLFVFAIVAGVGCIIYKISKGGL